MDFSSGKDSFDEIFNKNKRTKNIETKKQSKNTKRQKN